MKKEITPSQFLIILVLYILGSAILYIPTIQTLAADRNAWISVLVGGFISIFILILYAKLASTFPDLNLFEIINNIFGPRFGNYVNLTFTIYTLYLAALITRGTGDFLATTILTDTPIEILIFLILVTILIGANYGVVTIARALQVFFPIALISFFFSIMFVIPLMDIRKVYPILEDGLKPIGNGVIQILGFPYTEVIVLLSIFPYLTNKIKAKSTFIKAAVITTILFFIIVGSGITLLGAGFISRQTFGTYTIAKNFGIGSTILRLEALFSIIWTITIFVELVFCLIAICKSLKCIFKTEDYKTFLKPVTLILLPFSLLLGKNIVALNEWTTTIWPFYSITMGLIIPLVIYIIYKLKMAVDKSVQDI